MQRAAILPFAASLAPLYFSTLSHKEHDLGKNVIKRKMSIFIFFTTFI
jgi:hypothetical protein